jgi:sugar phosphate isomerase/epimerase
VNLRERIGVDISRRLRLEDAIEWAAKNGIRFIDIQLDTADNALTTFSAKRCTAVRKQLDKHGVKLGLHTLSAVNVAEYSPHVADAVTEYLKSYVDSRASSRRSISGGSVKCGSPTATATATRFI